MIVLSANEKLKAVLSKCILNESGCLEWNGKSLGRNGYPRIGWSSKNWRANRLVWILHGRKIPPKMYVCHKCDNPKCLNIDHLFIGSHTENMIDAIEKKRHCMARKTHCLRGHKFDKDNTYLTKRGSRQCRKCSHFLYVNKYKKQRRCK